MASSEHKCLCPSGGMWSRKVALLWVRLCCLLLSAILSQTCGRLRAGAWMEHVVGGRAGVLSSGRPDIGEVSQGRERSRAMAGHGPHTEW